MYTCSTCKKKCNVINIDTGIGPYEYWGQQCNDTHTEMVSDCCEASVIDASTGYEIDAAAYASECADDRGDWERDQQRDREWDRSQE